MSDINSGPGWYEVIHPQNATTCIALVYEDGSLYFPEGTQVIDQHEFAFAAARGKAHRLVRADEVAAHDRAVAAKALRDAADGMDDTDDPDAIYVANGDIDVWLRARADRIEAGNE
jgi:hypothetical protein